MKLAEIIASCVFFIVLPLGFYAYCFTESEFFLNPLIDTQLPPGFTLKKFEQIQPGMTKAQVLKILPPAMEIYTSNNHIVWGYGEDGAAPFGDFAWFRFEIEFDQQEKVLRTKREVFHD
ncbi:MAG TPA: hypothetical protein VK184_20630 [Nostocaceae cyanobacterium]|nr:hypothetical protein [Nostocaceae cyanobacterium]